ncbi:hypothetical protein PHAVU_001G083050 [Phaseolus vulgaris]
MPLTEIKIDPQSPSTFPHMNQLSTLNTNLTTKPRFSRLPHKMQIWKVGFWWHQNQKTPSDQEQNFKSQLAPKTRSRTDMNMLPERSVSSLDSGYRQCRQKVTLRRQTQHTIRASKL